MFDKTIITPTRTEHIPYTKTVIEKKAPTDASVKLLCELEAAAEQKILDRFHLKSNDCGVEAAVFVFSYDSLNTEVRAKFVINGAKFYISEELNQLAYDRHEAIEVVFKGVAKKLSAEMVKRSFNEIARLCK